MHPTINKRIWLLVSIMLYGVTTVFAQDKQILSARKSLASKSYSKVLSAAKKGIDKDKTAAEWYYLKACAEYELSLNPKYQGDKYSYDKDAVKSAVKARQHDKENNYYADYEATMQKIVDRNNREAMANFAKNSWAKAIQMYKNSYDLTGDTIAFGMLGMSYWGDHKEMDALRILREVTRWNYGAKSEGWGDGTFIREPFEIMSNYFLGKNQIDSALFYTEMGLSVYPKNRVLSYNESSILKSFLIEMGRYELTTDFIALVDRGLTFFPSDSFFLRQQNYYYLTQLMGITQTRPYDGADSLMDAFYAAKNTEVKSGIKNGYDEFLIADYNLFLFKCLDYYLRTNTKNTVPFCFKKLFVRVNNVPEWTEKIAESFLKNPADSVSRRLISMMYTDALGEFPWNKNFKKYRLAYFNNWMKKPRHRGELSNLLEMNDAVIADFPLDKTLKPMLQKNLISITDSSISEEKMYDCWTYFNRLRNEFPQTTQLDYLQQKLVKTDFQKRYSETRIYYTTVKNKKYANTGWNGEGASCRAGRLPDSTLYRVLHRVNYYRQNAGIQLPMNLSHERVQKCQEAAVMFYGKPMFTREPTRETHLCYTDGAKEAVAVAQGIRESNPAQCVTIFMDDSKSAELVNRRSILNPEALDMGFGSAEDNSVFWLLDLGGAPDSAYYKTHFVAWPPAGYCPKMLVFEKWSFSMAANLTDAKVTITDKNGESPSYGVTYDPIPGMLLNTLVMTLEIDTKKLTDKDFFNVTVELADKRKFTYKVTLF